MKQNSGPETARCQHVLTYTSVLSIPGGVTYHAPGANMTDTLQRSQEKIVDRIVCQQ